MQMMPRISWIQRKDGADRPVVVAARIDLISVPSRFRRLAVAFDPRGPSIRFCALSQKSLCIDNYLISYMPPAGVHNRKKSLGCFVDFPGASATVVRCDCCNWLQLCSKVEREVSAG